MQSKLLCVQLMLACELRNLLQCGFSFDSLQHQQDIHNNNEAAAMLSRSSTPPPILVSAKKSDSFPDNVREQLQHHLAVAACEKGKKRDLSGKLQHKAHKRHCHGSSDAAGQVWKFVNLKEICCKSIVHQDDARSTDWSVV